MFSHWINTNNWPFSEIKWYPEKIFRMRFLVFSKYMILDPKKPADVISKKYVLKIFVNFTGRHLFWSLFLVKLQVWRPATLLKSGSNTGVFLWNLRNFWEHLFWRTSARLLYKSFTISITVAFFDCTYCVTKLF